MKKALPLPSKEEIESLFDYREGKIYRKNGKLAGRVMPNGYVYICINKRSYGESRLVWKIHTGVDPVGQIDHVDRNRQNNRFENLRDVDSFENMLNTGSEGVSIHKKTGLYRARMMHKGKEISIGYFKTREEAVAHRKEFKELYMEMIGAHPLSA